MLAKRPMVDLILFSLSAEIRGQESEWNLAIVFLGFLAEPCVELLMAAGLTIDSGINRRKRDRKFLEPGLSKEGERHQGYKKPRESFEFGRINISSIFIWNSNFFLDVNKNPITTLYLICFRGTRSTSNPRGERMLKTIRRVQHLLAVKQIDNKSND